MPFQAGGSLSALFIGEQHPPGLYALGIEFTLRDLQGVVREVLVAEENAVFVQSCREEAQAALEVGIYRDPHGGSVPEIAVFVLNGGPVPRPGNEAARLGGEGVMGLVAKGAEGPFSHVHAVPVGGKLCARRRVLEIIPALPLIHKGAFDERLFVRAGKMHVQAEEPHGEAFPALLSWSSWIVRPLPSVFLLPSEDQLLFFSYRGHGLRIELLAVDGGGVGAAPVEIDPAVLVLEGIGVPEGEGLAQLFKVA